ncbi:MAG: PilZ domain-containing protein [Hyphomicrobiaceae bacterium]
MQSSAAYCRQVKMRFEKQERRRFGRRETNWAGRIVLKNHRAVRCTVRDCSVGGALIELLEPTYLPFRFILEVDISGFRSECEVRHQRGTRVGVEFVGIGAIDRNDTRNPISAGLDLSVPAPVPKTPMTCGELRALVRRP